MPSVRCIGIAFVVFAPAAVVTLGGQQEGHGALDAGGVRRDGGGVERAEDGPGAVDVVGAPAAEPGAVGLLFVLQPGDGAGDWGAVEWLANLGQE